MIFDKKPTSIQIENGHCVSLPFSATKSATLLLFPATALPSARATLDSARLPPSLLTVTAGKAARSIKLAMMNDRAAAAAEFILNHARLTAPPLSSGPDRSL